MSYPITHYSRTLADPRERAPLTGRAEGDCLVVGAGLAGLWVALELARAGRRVIVLEARRVGWGASGRNGGFVSPGFACGHDAIARRVGEDGARTLHRLSIEGAEMVRAEIERPGAAGVDPVPGILRLRRYDRGSDLRAAAEESQRLYGYPLEYLDRVAIRRQLDSTRYFHGLHDIRAFHIHPLNLARALAAEIERLGGQIFEQSPVTQVALDGPQKHLTTPQGNATAPDVVIATGGYTGAPFARLRRAMLPIATYVMLSEPAPDLLAATIRTRAAVGDDRRAGDYYRLVEGGQRLLWGGRISTRDASAESIVRQLRREMLTVYPQLGSLRTELAWSGLMSYARHLMPQIGQTGPGVWHCTAFGGHGLNTTAIGGRVVAEAILGASDRIRLFAPFGLEWAGGGLGLVAAQLTYWRLQAADWWIERGVGP